MIKVLRIFDLILIESVEIPFDRGFNVLSGETGSGKSAIMAAIALALGFRADTTYIRKGKDKGVVEAVFDFPKDLSFLKLLEESGIDFDANEELIIRREIFSTGKSRAFINNQMAAISLLKRVGSFLVKFVHQHANQQLQTLDFHLSVLDQYGNCETKLFSNSYKELGELKQKLKNLVTSEAERLREIETCKREWEEIDEVDPKPLEEEDLFQEYQLLTNCDEFEELCLQITQTLDGDKAVITSLNQLKRQFEELKKIDPTLDETFQLFIQSIVELQEVSHVLMKAKSRCESNPLRLSKVNERLSTIHQLKKKYGPTLEDIQNHKKQLEKKLENLLSADLQIEKVLKDIEHKENECDQLAKALTKKRQMSAKKMESALNDHLRSLNMPKVSFHIGISWQKRLCSGDDLVQFFFRPNVGEKEISVTECASGGELSRIMLCIQVLLAGKECIPTIIFDEIDANIGGQTAKAVGEKLRRIGKDHQVLCITHFPQVAACGDYHLQICKEEIDGRTLTLVQTLDEKSRIEELERMKGLSIHESQAV